MPWKVFLPPKNAPYVAEILQLSCSCARRKASTRGFREVAASSVGVGLWFYIAIFCVACHHGARDALKWSQLNVSDVGQIGGRMETTNSSPGLLKNLKSNLAALPRTTAPVPESAVRETWTGSAISPSSQRVSSLAGEVLAAFGALYNTIVFAPYRLSGRILAIISSIYEGLFGLFRRQTQEPQTTALEPPRGGATPPQQTEGTYSFASF